MDYPDKQEKIFLSKADIPFSSFLRSILIYCFLLCATNALTQVAQSNPYEICRHLNYDSCHLKLENFQGAKNFEWWYQAGMLHMDSGRYSAGLQALEKSIDLLPSRDDSLRAELWNNLGICAEETGQIKKALNNYRIALEIARNTPDSLMLLSKIYTNLGAVHSNNFNYETALIYQQKALEIDERLWDPNHPWIESDQFNLARVWRLLGNHRLEIRTLHEVYEKRKKREADLESISNVLNNLSVAYRTAGVLDSALIFAKQALRTDIQIGNNKDLLVNDYYNLCQIYLKKRDSHNSEIFWKKMVNIQESIGYEDVTLKASHLLIQARIYELKSEYSLAVIYYMEAIGKCLESTSKISLDRIGLYLEIITDLVNLEKTNTPERALKYISDALELLHWNQFSGDQLEGYERILSLREKLLHLGLDISANLYNRSQNSEFLDTFIVLSEYKHHFNFFREYLRHAIHRDIPESVRLISRELLHLQSHIHYERNQNETDDTLFAPEKKKRELHIRWMQELSKWERDSLMPGLFFQKPDLHLIKKWSKINHTGILLFTESHQNIYSLVILPDTLLFHTGSLDSLDILVNGLRMELERANELLLAAEEEKNSHWNQIRTFSKSLYDRLIRPVEKWLPEKLLILPDGRLYFFPLTILSPNLPTFFNLKTNHFPLLTKSLTYDYHLGSIFRKGSEPLLKGCFLFTGPFETQNNVNSHLYLRATASERHTIARYYSLCPGQFRESTTGWHFCTHTMKEEDGQAYILTGPNPDEFKNRLYLEQIYTMDVHSPLVMLASCRSAGDQVQYSLSRAFLLSGASQVIASAWDAHDEVTSGLCKTFYQALSCGTSVSASLNKSRQVHFESAANWWKHPYYWAGLMCFGANDVTVPAGFTFPWKGLLLVPGVLMILWLWYKKKRVVREWMYDSSNKL